jgi:chromosome segregation ATPase
MSLFSWFNSAVQVDTALIVVAIIGAIVEVGVAVAAVINVHKELEESRKEKLEKYIEIFACVAAFFFLAEAILGCRSSMLLSKEIEKFKGDNLALQTNVESLNGAVIQLAHQYDLSTNALAEANKRLAAIKPAKERLIDCLNQISKEIIPTLRGGQTRFRIELPQYLYNQLKILSIESGSAQYIIINPLEAMDVRDNGVGQTYTFTFELKPSILDP